MISSIIVAALMFDLMVLITCTIMLLRRGRLEFVSLDPTPAESQLLDLAG